MPFYSIKPRAAANPQAAEVFIYGDIGDSFWDESTTSAANFVKEFGAIDADEITIRINSFGGSVVDGIAIYNAIRRHRADVHTEIDGIAYSIASMIAMAGDTRGMAANARLMIHAPWSIAFGNAAEMRTTADDLDQYAELMAGAYVTASGKEQADILSLLTDGEDHYYTAEQALD
ncbi:MAG TPA: head maturation protease, ClpP-related, partial [Guyparkeria sp.]|nr:head maturation protease, ClpP-related [Guyparkeria sp.]